MRGLRYVWAMGVLALCGMATSGRAGVTTTGDTNDSTSVFYAGFHPNTGGTLQVDSGSVLNRSAGHLGFGPGSTGTAAITGSGSKWTNSGNLYVGNNGIGLLRVEAGGQVSDAKGCLGYESGSTGTAVIAGAGSGWSNANALYVGVLGVGTVRVEAGGQINDGFGCLGERSGSMGAMTVTGGGSKWIISSSLYVGQSGSGALNVEDGAQVRSVLGFLGYYSGSTGEAIITGAGSKWTNSNDLAVGTFGRGTLRIGSAGQVDSLHGFLGEARGSTGAAVIAGAGSTWTNGATLYVGLSGSGAVRVEAGGQVSSRSSYLGYNSGSTGTVIVTGAGSGWTNSSGLFVGYEGGGVVRVEAGGQVSSTHDVPSNGTYLGFDSGSTGAVVVTGTGSKWTDSGTLYVGYNYNASGSLAVSDGGQVTAKSLSINRRSTVRLHVSGDRMLVLGNFSTVGGVSNAGKLSLLADAFLPAGTYRPIGGFAGWNVDWSGGGSTLAVGGAWDSSAKTFTVTESVRLDAGTAADVVGGRRLLVSDVGSGEQVGVSLGALSAGTTLKALPLTESERAALLAMLGPEETIVNGWDFAGQLAGGEALVSLEVGLGSEEVRLWRRSGNVWSEYMPEMMTHDSKGIVSFTVNPASLNGSGYAVSGMVPEPAGMALLVIATGLMLRRRGRKDAAPREE